ncbi:DUF202 domain-containing protein [Nocardioides sp. NPDC057772]|uniref:DUF202 domain-containing protein n=1 Tax=Nocardioides sp. NPDC057772 TaxID=3346245 RepID=UPI00366F3CFC
MTSPPRVDEGAANERTALSWQRTALSLLGGSAIIARLTWQSMGFLILLPLGVAALLALWVFIESRGRYSHDAGTRSRGRSRGGIAPTALAISTTLLAATELAALTVG